jgi:hypothetical protein
MREHRHAGIPNPGFDRPLFPLSVNYVHSTEHRYCNCNCNLTPLTPKCIANIDAFRACSGQPFRCGLQLPSRVQV